VSSPLPVVGWYVHHHGAGHVTRFSAVRPHLRAHVVAFSSLPAPADLPADTEWVVLPRDDDPVASAGGTRRPGDASPTVRGLLHWAPLHHPGHTDRLAAIAGWIGRARPAAVVVDVSVEVTLLVRLLGVPPVVVTQPGDRSDEPHRLAFTAAERVLAPWAPGVHGSPALDDAADRVRHVGGISRFAGRARVAPAGSTTRPTVLVLPGGDAGGAGRLVDAVSRAAAATPHASWTLLGGEAGAWVADPWSSLSAADVVVTAAGQNSVADLAAAGARAVVVPQDRPFDEQRTTARVLAERGLAVVVDEWPADHAWPDLLDRALASTPDWSAWQVDGAAARAADVVAEVASWQR
jgi:hypothetical protein